MSGKNTHLWVPSSPKARYTVDGLEVSYDFYKHPVGRAGQGWGIQGLVDANAEHTKSHTFADMKETMERLRRLGALRSHEEWEEWNTRKVALDNRELLR